ncbi:MAG: hypothetical protein KGZ51_03510 [Erysipelothrix sp.]|nr:hypothetical protein [Erysipelothrix sp.]
MIQLQLNRSLSSTILADIHATQMRRKSKDIDFSQPIVNVGKLGIGRKTLVGNSKEYIDKASIVDEKEKKNKSEEYKYSYKDDGTIYSESHAISKRVTSTIGKAAGIVVIGSMIIGPPTVGYILFDWLGFAVGSMVAAPFVMMFVWTLMS